MPIKEEKMLIREARKKGIKKGSDRWGAYVYGTLNKIKKARAAKRK